MLVAGEVMAGLAIGFAVQIGFSCALVAGEVIGNAMGLGFAAMMDPATGQQNPVLGQFLSIVATLLFLADRRPSRCSPRSSSKAIMRCRPAMPG